MSENRSRSSLIGCLALVIVALLATNALLLVFGSGIGAGRTLPGAPPAPAHVALPAPTPVTPRASLAEIERTTIEIFRRAAPSVVYITNFAVRSDKLRPDVLAIPQGTGSGFVWDAAGHIVTNYHVIHGASALRVTFADQTSVNATVVGVAPDKDLAVIRVQGPAQLQPLPVGSSHDLQVGQMTLAIGNPFGLDHTLSSGIVSGLDREITSVGGRPITGVIQTDAAINPGNSGGPLLDSAGRLMGVNTAIYSPSGASVGVGFAVPVDTVRRIVPQLIEHGRATRPGLGVQLEEGGLARRLGVRGVIVIGVVPGSPAERAGLVPARRDGASGQIVLGDVIVSLDGEAISEPNDLYRVIDRHDVGDRVRLGLARGRATRDVELELSALPGE
jgi:S1-C subfamily serine protease